MKKAWPYYLLGAAFVGAIIWLATKPGDKEDGEGNSERNKKA